MQLRPLSLALAAILTSGAALAQSASTLDTVIVTGTRVADRTVAESQSPIDIISPETLAATGTLELATALSRALPSLNFPRPALTDGTSGVRPAQLRGLAPDQVLVLINGKRRHLAPQLHVNGSVGRGSQTVDFNTIPVSAIERVEVLRDGASAQYGSDAIAGVVNIVLKGAGEGGSLSLTGGQYSAGDGEQAQIAGDAGLSFADGRGTLHVAGQVNKQDITNRTGPYAGTSPNTGNNPGIGEVAFKIGDPEVEYRGVSANAGFRFNDQLSAYATAIASNRDITSFAFYRSKNHNAATSLLYPDGFVPEINQFSQDRSLIAGLKGRYDSGFAWDISYNYGVSKLLFHTRNTMNYSLGAASPRSFYDGALEYTHNILNADFTQSLDWGLAYPATLSFGAEYREEKWNQGPGELNSYNGGGAQGFGGFTPINAGQHDRDNVAVYAGLEADFSDNFSAGIAARYEDYSDFGNETSGKLSLRYAFSDAVALRGTVASGFRAPSLAQQNYQAITSTSLGGTFVERGTFPASSAAAQALGAEPLKAETSLSFSLGLVLQPVENLYVTLDAYQIEVDDRITLSSVLDINPATKTTQAQIDAANAAQAVLNAAGINGVTAFNYFTNAVDTRTRGIDLVADYRIPLDASTLGLTASYSYNKTEITGIAADPAVWAQFAALSPSRLGRDEAGRIEQGFPRDKFVLGGTWNLDRWDVNLGLSRYGKFTTRNNTDPTRDQTFDAKWVVDASVAFRPDSHWTLTLGADNLFNEYPDQNIFANSTSGQFKYSNSSPFGFNGAFVYGKIGYQW